jgi:hypothetical protein
MKHKRRGLMCLCNVNMNLSVTCQMCSGVSLVGGIFYVAVMTVMSLLCFCKP